MAEGKYFFVGIMSRGLEAEVKTGKCFLNKVEKNKCFCRRNISILIIY